MIMCDPLSKEDGSRLAPRTGDRLNRGLAHLGRLLFTHRLEIGLGVTAAAAPFVQTHRGHDAHSAIAQGRWPSPRFDRYGSPRLGVIVCWSSYSESKN